MIPLSLARIAEITGARLHRVLDPDAVVTGPVVHDSRAVRPGGLFAAVPGERVDGHDFCAVAVAAGAVAVLATRPVRAPALLVPDVPSALAALAAAVVTRLPDVTVVGITGSAGKTTTKDLVASLAERLGPTVSPVGSYNNELGHPLTVLRADERTRYLVLELSARGAGHIAAQCRIAPPKLGAVLNVGHAHTEMFGGLDQVAAAKGELVAVLPADGVAVLNAADLRVAAMARRSAARVVTFGPAEVGDSDVRATGTRLDEAGRPAFTLVTPGDSAEARLRLHGAHNVQNALAAAALAAELGMSVPDIADGLSAATPRSRWRMEVTTRPDGVTVINDAYNANPESVLAALDTLGHVARGRRAIAVLGPMAELGACSRQRHDEVGAAAARAGVAGLVVVGASDPDGVDGILAGARREPGWRGDAIAVPDVAEAVTVLADMVAPQDVLLVKASRVAGLERVAAGLLAEPSVR